VEGKGVRCTKCGIKVTKEDVPTLEGKGFIIEYRQESGSIRET
jgi:hypothetical protein